jgi:hypothetical protein
VLISSAASLLQDADIRHRVADSHMGVIDGSINAANRVLVVAARNAQARELFGDAGVALEA